MLWIKTVFVRQDAPASRKHPLQSLLDEHNKGVGHFSLTVVRCANNLAFQVTGLEAGATPARSRHCNRPAL